MAFGTTCSISRFFPACHTQPMSLVHPTAVSTLDDVAPTAHVQKLVVLCYVLTQTVINITQTAIRNLSAVGE